MAWSIKNTISDVVLAYFEGGDWLSDGHLSEALTDEDRSLIRWVIDNGYIPEPIIMNAVHDGICAYGRASYLIHVCSLPIIPIDHTGFIRAIGYAIRYAKITEEEAREIIFDHNDSLAGCLKSSEGLLDWAMEQLRKGAEKNENEWNQGGCLNCGMTKG